MKRTIIGLSATVALAAIVLTLGGLDTTRAQSQQGGQGNQGNQGNQSSVVGAWTVTVYVNGPGGALLPFATEFATFNPGGTFSDAINLAFNSENPAFAGPLAAFAVNFSDAYGSWKQVGDDPNQIAGTFKRFLYAGASTPASVYGSFFPGQHVGEATVQFTGTVQNTASGQTLSGSFTFQLTNLQGAVVLSGSGPFAATRIKVQPLST
jgi:hypothetical protein